jgi:radical SAM superfamily enzyme YgiQ (UPF0313 family)
MNVVLISTYELGHQPFGLASPAAWLAAAGAAVTCLDLSVQPFDRVVVAQADLVAIYLPMYTATRLAADVIRQICAANPHAHLCCYGLYAPMNEPFLRALGVATILGGEFESGLVALYRRLAPHPPPPSPTRGEGEILAPLSPGVGEDQPEPRISLAKQDFLTPDRSGLPGLAKYAFVELSDGKRRTAGYTEASRGCKHVCRHCPIVPVYGGRFRVVSRAAVLADIRQQVSAGARHITFGDPDFFNGPTHALALVQALHAEFPTLTYDVTIKIEHLLKHASLLPALRDTGCLFVTSAVEAIDDAILERFDKRHTRADFICAAGLLREVGLALNPTFVTFTPWTTRRGYLELLELIAALDLVEHVAPIQYAIRLLIPAGSRLLELPEVQALVQPYDQAALAYPWAHPDARMDLLYREVLRAVSVRRAWRQASFDEVRRLARATLDAPAPRMRYEHARRLDRMPIPHMSEPWYC